MQKTLLTIIIAALLAVSAQAVQFGVYDFDSVLTTNRQFSTEHIFVSWKDYDGSLIRQLNAIRARGRTPLVTIEPWATSLSETASGSKDNVIRHMAQDVALYAKPVTIRFMRECENVTGRYPWASHDSGTFILAFPPFCNNFQKCSTERQVYVESGRRRGL
jgi:beta-mannanase